ncbi:hypothetical protein ABK040_015789 [Willaertia magna]
MKSSNLGVLMIDTMDISAGGSICLRNGMFYSKINRLFLITYSLNNVIETVIRVLNEIKNWHKIFQDINSANKNNNFTLYSTKTVELLKNNLKTLLNLKKLLPQETEIDFYVFGIRSLESYFKE